MRANRNAPGERGGDVELGLLRALDRLGRARRRRAAGRARAPAPAAAAALGSVSMPTPGAVTLAPDDRRGVGLARRRAGLGGVLARALGLRGGGLARAPRPRGASAPAWPPPSRRPRGLLGLGLLLLGAPLVGDRELLAQLGGARLGVGAVGLGVGLGARGGRLARSAPSASLVAGATAPGFCGSSLTRGDLPRTPEPKSGGRASSSRSRPARRAPASRPDHIRRLTMSLSVIGGGSLRGRAVGMRFEARRRSSPTTKRLARS